MRSSARSLRGWLWPSLNNVGQSFVPRMRSGTCMPVSGSQPLICHLQNCLLLFQGSHTVFESSSPFYLPFFSALRTTIVARLATRNKFLRRLNHSLHSPPCHSSFVSSIIKMLPSSRSAKITLPIERRLRAGRWRWATTPPKPRS